MLSLIAFLLCAWGMLCLVGLILRILPPKPLTQTTVPRGRMPLPRPLPTN
jgi:hypothetical protein